jgi:transporter family-2 protein
VTLVLAAVLNGAVVGASRAVNGRLSVHVGALRASFWNHAGGFAFLTALVPLAGGWRFGALPDAPPQALLGGLLGALYVALNSRAFARLGAANATLLVIAGQMTTAVLLDLASRGQRPSAARLAGVALVLLGVYAAKRRAP